MSPRLETRLSSERVMPDLERLWLSPPLLFLGSGELVVVDSAGLCLCGLGDRRVVMGMGWQVEGE